MPGKKAGGLKTIGLVTLSVLGGFYLSKKAAGYLFRKAIHPLITKKYDQNLWELASSIQRLTPNVLVETELRAHTSAFIERPLGSPRKHPYLDKIMFNIAQLETLPTPEETEIDTGVVIGPAAKRPLKLKIPILISGMGYGVALTEAYKIAFAMGAGAAGTAANTGVGPWLETERKAAKHLILQYPRAAWNKDEKIIKQSDAVEIQFGQGASAGIGKTIKAKTINKKLRQRMGLKSGQDAVLHNRLESVNSQKELATLIDYLRNITGGVPIGVKIAAGKYIEADLKIAVEAGADFISIDGAEAGTHNSLPILQDDFGLPTLIAAARAARFWQEYNLKGRVSLLIGGGLVSPGDCLKMLALGADAVYMGTAVLIAATHTQILKALPFEPPSQIAYEYGKLKDKFNIEEGAESLANFLNATVYEMAEAVKALGKTSIRQVSKEDLFTVDREVAEITGLELGFQALYRK
ncbi:MAG: FMN-binding glutamate synthase family protein [Peptococcaceae bacterium]|jgi:glutamate synthase domain-containing protein 2|nr:MAG: FMN-binding glutamate synthase family protein [Peptococcaceae bacterium]